MKRRAVQGRTWRRVRGAGVAASTRTDSCTGWVCSKMKSQHTKLPLGDLKRLPAALRRLTRQAVLASIWIGATTGGAQGPRTPTSPPGWQFMLSDIEADQSRKPEERLPIPSALSSEISQAEREGAQITSFAQAS